MCSGQWLYSKKQREENIRERPCFGRLVSLDDLQRCLLAPTTLQFNVCLPLMWTMLQLAVFFFLPSQTHSLAAAGMYAMETSAADCVQLCSLATQVFLPVLSVLPTLALCFLWAVEIFGNPTRMFCRYRMSRAHPARTNEIILVPCWLPGHSQALEKSKRTGESFRKCFPLSILLPFCSLDMASGVQWDSAFPLVMLLDFSAT